MRLFLGLFRANERMWGRGYLPSAPAASRAAAASDVACRGLAVATLAFELAVVPSTLAWPAARRPGAAWAFLAFHAGIHALMSKSVAYAFATTAPVYAAAFAAAPVAHPRLAAAVGLLPGVVNALGWAVPEQWPLSGCALYMFNGDQAAAIVETLTTRSTRLVFADADATAATVARRPVFYHGRGPPPAGRGPLCHDAIMRCVGLTLVADGLLPLFADPASTRDFAALVDASEQWLATGALVEADSGAPLARAFVVEVHGAAVAKGAAGRIARVLYPPPPP